VGVLPQLRRAMYITEETHISGRACAESVRMLPARGYS